MTLEEFQEYKTKHPNEPIDSFKVLNTVNVSDKVEQKIGLNYLSWANAWAVLKTYFPDATYKIYTRKIEVTETTKTNDDGIEKTVVSTYTNEIPYFSDGRTVFVKVGVTVMGNEEIELFPVMDNKNNAVPVSMISSTVVNKALQRAFVKACARQGLGLYIYAGEDLPEVDRKPPVDYRKLANDAEKIVAKPLSDDEFAAMKQYVIAQITNKQSIPEVTSFCGGVLSGHRVGLLTNEPDDAAKLQKLHTYFRTLAELE